MQCPKCGNELLEGAVFCNKCGASFQETQQSVPTVVTEQPTVAPKKTGKVLIIVIVVLLLLAIGTTAGFFIGKKVSKGNVAKCETTAQPKNEEPQKEEEKKEEEDDDIFGSKDKIHKPIDASKVPFKAENDLAKNFEVVKIIYNQNKKYLQVLAKNNGKTPLSYRAHLNYYDKTGTRIDKASDSGYVDPGRLFAFDFYNSTEEEFETVEVTISADTYKSTYHPTEFNKDSFKVMETEDSVNIYYKNDTKKPLTGAFVGVFYKDNQMVYFDEFSFYDVAPGVTKENKAYLVSFPDYDSSKPMKNANYFDKYEITISYLYHFEDDY